MKSNAKYNISVHHVSSTNSVIADRKIYCGRSKTPKGLVRAEMGNMHQVGVPCACGKTHTRGAAIQAYDDELSKNPNHEHHRLIRLIGLRLHQGLSIALFCHCDPLPCHCDVIRRRSIQHAATL